MVLKTISTWSWNQDQTCIHPHGRTGPSSQIQESCPAPAGSGWVLYFLRDGCSLKHLISIALISIPPAPRARLLPERAASCSQSQRGARGRHLPPYVPTWHPFPLHSCILPGITRGWQECLPHHLLPPEHWKASVPSVLCIRYVSSVPVRHELSWLKTY